MQKKIIAFDLDGTLAESKSPATDEMAEVLNQLLEKFQVCVISGGRFEQFEKQLLSNLKADPIKMQALHLLPTCGTRYYRYDVEKASWHLVYAEDFTPADKKKIIRVVKEQAEILGLLEKHPYGEIIEDRESQITFSALGQDIVDHLGLEGVRLKEAWDPDNKKKEKLAAHVGPLLPEFEVRVGGLSSIDITKPGIDKAYGMKKLMDMLEVSKEEILFFGDRLTEGGNDYPVKAMGIDSLEVSHWQHTLIALRAILAVS